MITNIAKTFSWQAMIVEGKFADVNDFARAIGKDDAYVSRIIRFTLLAPEIIYEVLAGQMDPVGGEKCKQPFPVL